MDGVSEYDTHNAPLYYLLFVSYERGDQYMYLFDRLPPKIAHTLTLDSRLVLLYIHHTHT
jgi:hypothetical protein